MMPVRRCQAAIKFRVTPEGFYEPTYPSDPRGINMTLWQVEPSKLRAPDVDVENFYLAIARIKPSVSEDDHERHIVFSHTF
jgi:hypothetical protein